LVEKLHKAALREHLRKPLKRNISELVSYNVASK
jgi:hypothetical protein